jgi:23S rRNA (cytidine1920-2'-O)/16S rRNA (cytidine1409-2'-O)-methyltransferase
VGGVTVSPARPARQAPRGARRRSPGPVPRRAATLRRVRRRLDAELVRRGLVPSRARAAELIAAGRVRVAGAPADKPARQVSADEPIVVDGEASRFASRGGDKLDAALARWSVHVADRRWLDAGASTGGFTDCLLQRGAAHVVAVDVGRGQLAWSLRSDPRVEVHDGVNVRHLDLERIGEPVDGAVADVSFISLATIAPALVRVVRPGGPVVALVKPQFEAGPGRVGSGGVVRDPEVHRVVLASVVTALAESGIDVVDLMASPLRGPAGNVEFLALARRRPEDGEPPSGAEGGAHGDLECGAPVDVRAPLAGDALAAAITDALAEAPPP